MGWGVEIQDLYITAKVKYLRGREGKKEVGIFHQK